MLVNHLQKQRKNKSIKLRGDSKLVEELVIKYCVINHLILQKIRNRMNINTNLLQWSITSRSGIKNENMSNKELAKESKTNS